VDQHRFAELMDRLPWTFAKTVPEVPHEYVVAPRGLAWPLFDDVVRYLHRNGRLARWGARYVHYYVEHDGRLYWVVGRHAVTVTRHGKPFMVNRERVEHSTNRWLDTDPMGPGDRTLIRRWAGGEPCQACLNVGLEVEWRTEDGTVVGPYDPIGDERPFFICPSCGIQSKGRPGW
jgi:hypothetical protein